MIRACFLLLAFAGGLLADEPDKTPAAAQELTCEERGELARSVLENLQAQVNHLRTQVASLSLAVEAEGTAKQRVDDTFKSYREVVESLLAARGLSEKDCEVDAVDGISCAAPAPVAAGDTNAEESGGEAK